MFKCLLITFSVFSLSACGQKGSVPLLAKDQKMDTIFFWKLMDNAFDNAGFNNRLKEQTILDNLTKLTPEQIQQFEIIFQQMNQKASTWSNMAAHTIIQGSSSDDSFYYFRCWLISLGRHNFEETLKDPDYLVSIDIPINKKYGYGEIMFEELISISDHAYSIVTEKQTEDESFPRTFAQNAGLFYDTYTDMKGNEWSYSDLPRIAPKLYKKFGRK